MAEAPVSTRIIINGIEFPMQEILTFRFSDNNKRMVLLVVASPEKKLLNQVSIADPDKIHVEFYQTGDKIVDFETSAYDLTLDFNGVDFAEKLEVISEVTLF